jgi:CheY-like chemotaxis protein
MTDPESTTILIAEDDRNEAFFLRRAFEEAGLPYQLRFVVNGQEAIDYLQGKPPFDNRQLYPLPKVVLLDLNMPLRDGFDVLQWLKSESKLQNLPAVVHTSSILETDRERAKGLGAKGFYVKTSEAGEMAAMFKELADHWLDTGLPSAD